MRKETGACCAWTSTCPPRRPAPPPPPPLVVGIQGGGGIAGDKGFRVLVRDLTREGLAVASVQYRLSYVAPYPAGVDDCAQALAWLRAHGARFGVDPARMGLAGESSGGHYAALLGLRQGRPRVRAVLALYPPTDLPALNDAHDGGRKYNLIARFLGGSVPDRLREADEASPARHVGPDAPPFRLIHGADDGLVPPDQSRRLHAALRRRGAESELVILPERGHAFALDAEQMAQAARFFRRHLGAASTVR